MIVSKSKKFIYFHNPKSAGSSMTLALAPYCTKWKNQVEKSYNRGWQCKYHHDNKQHCRMSQTRYTEFQDYYKFAFVRNPWEMVLSFYEKTKQNGRHKIENFEDFLYSSFYLKRSALRITQSQYLDKPLDFVGKIENLEEDWKKIRSIIGIGDDLPHVNKKKDVGWKNYRQVYTSEQRDLVAERYKRDIDLYKYDF